MTSQCKDGAVYQIWTLTDKQINIENQNYLAENVIFSTKIKMGYSTKRKKLKYICYLRREETLC